MAEDEKENESAEGGPEKKKAPPPGSGVVDASFDDEAEGGDVAEPKAAAPLVRKGDLEEDEEEEDDDALPAQMGYRRYIYAAFFCFAIALAYFLSRAGLAGWHKLSQYTSKVGEPREDLVTPIAAVFSGLAAFFTYRRAEVRQLADEVALELSKVEWPTKEKVRRSTTIVVVATLGSSLAFWLYDIGANKGVSFVTGSEHPLLYGIAAGVLIYMIRALGSRYLAGKA